MISVLPNGGFLLFFESQLHARLHSMISVLPNGGATTAGTFSDPLNVALDDISATEWRKILHHPARPVIQLHSMISVLPNGGEPTNAPCSLYVSRCTR